MNDLNPEAILKDHFGLIGEISQLPGERDLNFKVVTDQVYVLKLYEAGNHDWLELQDFALRMIEIAGIPTPIQSKQGHFLIDLPNGRTARLLQWVDGEPWAKSETDSNLLQTLGAKIALVDKKLATIAINDNNAKVLNRQFIWNLLQAGSLITETNLIKDSVLQAAVSKVLQNFKDKVIPKLRALPTQVIHNDGNDYNILVDGNRLGLIDFGDIVIAPKIVGLAVCAAYMVLEKDEPIKEILPLIRGYHMVAPLTPAELEILFDLIQVRLAMSVVNAAIQSKSAPANQYLLISQGVVPDALIKLAKTDRNHSHFRFRDACGYEGNPNSRAIRQYLESVAKPSDVVCKPFANAKKYFFNWSIDNPALPRTEAELNALMAQVDAQVSIGYYCEERNVYQGEAFNIKSPSARTFHLGVDLGMPAGSAVYAPLDGEVYAFNDNNTYLDYGPVIMLKHLTDTGIPFWTLYGHLSRTSLLPLTVGMKIKAGDQIATMGVEAENVGWPPHTHFQLLTDLCGMGLDVHGVAPRDEVSLWRSISPNPNLILRIKEGTDAHGKVSPEVIRNQRDTVLSQNLSLNFRTSLQIVKGEGAYLFDQTGKKYLDLVNNVAHVGHGHPRVVAAGANQMATLNTNTRYLHQNIVEYGRALTSTLPDPLTVIFFVNSGSEANDLAIRLAHAYTKRKGMIALKHGYHGHTQSVVEISPYKFLGKGGAGTPAHVGVAELPDPFRGQYRGEGAGIKYAADFANVISNLKEPLAAFFCEGIVSTGGQIRLAEGFLKSAFAQIRAAGGICISDEVQIGLGRVGEKFWGFELHGVVPDIVTMGKPLGNGHPLAAVVTTPEIAAAFHNGMEYFNTFGGNPVSAAIGQAVLDVVQDENLQANAIEIGSYLSNGVKELSKSHPIIGDVRGSGLFIGVELMRDENTPATAEMSDLIEYAKDAGVFLSCDGPDNNILKIKPPMIITKTDVDLFLNVFDAGVRAITK